METLNPFAAPVEASRNAAEEIDLGRIETRSCDLICADASRRSGTAVYEDGQLRFVARDWTRPRIGLAATLGNSYSFLAALIAVADFHEFGGQVYGEIAIKPAMIAALTGLTSRTTILRKLRRLANTGYLIQWPSDDSQSATLIRLPSANLKTAQIIFDFSKDWAPGYIKAVEPGALRLKVQGRGRNFAIEHAAMCLQEKQVEERVRAAPIIVMGPRLVPARTACVQDPFFSALDIPDFRDLVRARRGQLPPEVETLAIGEAAGGDQLLVRSIFHEGREIKLVLSQAASGIGQKTPDHELIPSGIRHDHDNDHDGDNQFGATRQTDCLMAPGAGAPAAPTAAPPAASGLALPPISQRITEQRRWMAVEAKRGGRITLAARKELQPGQQRVVEAYEACLGLPFCHDDLPHLKATLRGRPWRFVVRAIEAFGKELDQVYRITRGGMAHIVNPVADMWGGVQEHNVLAAAWSRRGPRAWEGL